ncbi:MAG: type II toxin-antitoxin system death-on-curing family toxin [Gemmatimonadota bacterium]
MTDSSEEPLWVSRAAIEAAHANQIREHGGQPGIRDPGLLESALARPRHRWSFEPECDLATLAASLGLGLIKNHPFLDGNKRAGLVAMNMFLILNGQELEAPEPAVVEAIIRVADGSLHEEGLAAWIRSVAVSFTP